MQERRKHEMSMLEVLDNLEKVAQKKKRKVLLSADSLC